MSLSKQPFDVTISWEHMEFHYSIFASSPEDAEEIAWEKFVDELRAGVAYTTVPDLDRYVI